MKFIADAMLGRLARWLRILGHDTMYNSSLDDARLLLIARREDRRLLSRDGALCRRAAASALFIRDDDVREQLRQMRDEAGVLLRPSETPARCPVCNGQLVLTAVYEISGRVPPYVAATAGSFSRCAACGRIFWPGTHAEKIAAFLARFNETSAGR